MDKKTFFEQEGKCFFFDNPETIADYVKENCKDYLKLIMQVADDTVAQSFMFTLRWDMERTHEPVVFDEDIDWLYQPGDDPEWIYAFNRMRFWICLGQAYAVTGDEKYAKAFVKQLKSWVKNVPNIEENAQAWRSIEVGLRLEYWQKAMQYFKYSPEITDEVIDIFVGSITEHAEFIMDVWNTFNLMSNWGVLANHGLFLAGCMLPENDRIKEYRKVALDRLTQEIEIQVYRDGTHWEQSPMYHNEVLHCYLDVVLLAQRCNVELPKVLYNKTEAMCLYNAYTVKPNHSEPLMGDSDEIDTRDQTSKGAVIFKNKNLRFAGYDIPDFDTIWDIGEEGLKLYDSIESKAFDSLDFELKDSGGVYMRSGWGEDDTWVHFQCGPLGAGHGHADKLHVDISTRGEDIITDLGRFTYVFGEGRVQFKELKSHNTVMVDNEDLYRCKDSWECDRLAKATNLKSYSNENYAYTEGGHTGYLSYLENGVYINRRVIYIKPDIVILVDEFYTQGNHDYNQFFHFAEDSILDKKSDVNWLFTKGNAKAEVKFVGDIKSEVIDSQISRFYNKAVDTKGIKTSLNKTGSGSMITVIGLSDKDDNRELKVTKNKVESNFKDITFDDETIESIDVKLGDMHYTVVVAHKEFATPTDTFLASGCSGFGSCVVFDRSKNETEIGTVLSY